MFKNLTKLYTPFDTLFTQCRFAGHSKWQNIRHIKAQKDGARNLLFTRLSRQMKVAVHEGGSTDVKKNLKLEHVIEQAKRASMPAATIQSVLKSCENDKSNSKMHLVELKGPGGCIILCEVFTPAIHIVRQNISTILKKNKAKYSDGGGMHLFEQKGIIEVELSEKDKSNEKLLEEATDHAIEAGAEDVKIIEDLNILQFTCGATSLKIVTTSLEKFNYKINSSSVEYTPLKFQPLDEEDLTICANLCEKLEALPEVVKLSDNVA